MRRILLLTLAVSLAALAQDSGEVEIVIIPKTQLAALLQRLAVLQAERDKREEADRAARVMMGCT